MFRFEKLECSKLWCSKCLFYSVFKKNKSLMGTFVISKRVNGDYKFIFATRKGKTIFTSIGCNNKSDCEKIIAAIQGNIEQFTLTRSKNAAGKYFFRLAKDGLVLATSRKFSTEFMFQKGIDNIKEHLPNSETLDFSENEFVFPDSEAVFVEEE